jgi:RimJ/RimL family protein N-acetyltransferase
VSTTYEFRVSGHLDGHWSTWLGELDLNHHADGTSTLTGLVADQAQLHGLLAGFRDIGAPLLAVRALSGEVNPIPLQRVSWPVHTERLTLRAAGAEDAEPTWRFRRLEPVGRWLTEVPMTLAAYRSTFADPARLATTLVVELDGRVIGDLMLRVEDAWAQAEVVGRAQGVQAELAWVLDPAFTGRGYATEAVRELVRICFQDLGLRRVVATCFADNEASRRLMERVGLRREVHAVSDALHRSGEWLDTYGYALLANEWPAPPCRGT